MKQEVHFCPILMKTVIWKNEKCTEQCKEDCPVLQILQRSSKEQKSV